MSSILPQTCQWYRIASIVLPGHTAPIILLSFILKLDFLNTQPISKVPSVLAFTLPTLNRFRKFQASSRLLCKHSTDFENSKRSLIEMLLMPLKFSKSVGRNRRKSSLSISDSKMIGAGLFVQVIIPWYQRTVNCTSGT